MIYGGLPPPVNHTIKRFLQKKIRIHQGGFAAQGGCGLPDPQGGFTAHADDDANNDEAVASRIPREAVASRIPRGALPPILNDDDDDANNNDDGDEHDDDGEFFPHQ